MKLPQGKFSLDIRKRLFTEKVSGLPREEVMASRLPELRSSS